MKKLSAIALATIIAGTAHADDNADTSEGPFARVPSKSQIEDLSAAAGAADTQASRGLISLALDLIKHFEGWEPSAYNDPAGYCTIGYGHLIALAECDTLPVGTVPNTMTEEQGSNLLLADSSTARLAVETEVTVELTDEEFGALTSFVFNVGKGNFKRSTLLKLVNIESDFAADEFSRWVRADGVVLPGLEIRRACEEALFRGSLMYAEDGSFDRSLCEVADGAASDVGQLIDIEIGE